MRIPVGAGVVRNRETASPMSFSETESSVNMGKMAMTFADKMLDERAETLAQETRNTYQQKMNDLNMKFTSRKGKEAIGATEEFMKEAQSIEKDLTAGLGKRSVGKMGDFTTRVGENYRMNMMQYERGQELEFNKGEFEKGLTIASDMVRQDAKNWSTAVTHLDSTLETGLKAGLWTEQEHLTKRTELTNKFRGELGKNYYTQDKHDFMKNIGQFGFGKPEIEAYKMKYQNDLAAEQRELKTLNAEEANLLWGKRDDMKAQAMANSDTSHFFENANKLEKLGYKERANELREEGNTYSEVVNFREQHKAKPLSEMIKATQELTVGSELDGSSSKFKANEAIKAEMKNAVKLYDKDPAGWVSQFAQGSNMEEVASSRLSLQEQQGIYPSKGFKILTVQENQNLKGSWETGDARQRAELIIGTKEKFGKHASKVFTEMEINQAVTLSPFIEDSRDVEMLVAGVSSKPQILDDNQKSAYATAAKKSEFYGVLLEVQSRFPTNPDLPKKISDVEMAMTGIGARKVNPDAGAQFFDERFETVNSADKVIYFPKSKNSDEVEEALDAKKAELTAKFKSGNEMNDNLSRWALRDAVWVNSSRGFVLADPRSGTYIQGSEVDMMNPEQGLDLAKFKKAKADLVTYTRR